MKNKDYKKLKTTYGRLCTFIIERESVRLRKERLERKPWTDNEILKSYRFCNVRRMDDYVSKWLMDNWYSPNFDHPNMLVATAFARFINLPETLEFVGFPSIWKPKLIYRRLANRRDEGNKTFNSAYVVRGNDGRDKIDSVVFYYCDPLIKDRPKIYKTMKDTVSSIQEHHGFGSFMAGQVTADLRWNTKAGSKFTDIMTWAAMGPGSKRGMNRLFGNHPNESLNQEEFEELLTQMIRELNRKLPATITRRLEAHDYQNCLCEFDKFERMLWGEGQMRKKYDGHQEQKELF